eukprot:100040-Chlamydomonas_euryale.AAC.1
MNGAHMQPQGPTPSRKATRTEQLLASPTPSSMAPHPAALPHAPSDCWLAGAMPASARPLLIASRYSARRAWYLQWGVLPLGCGWGRALSTCTRTQAWNRDLGVHTLTPPR